MRRFRKATCPIVERLACALMFHGRNAGKKLMAVRIMKHTFEIIHLLTDQNPLQVLVNAVINPNEAMIFVPALLIGAWIGKGVSA